MNEKIPIVGMRLIDEPTSANDWTITEPGRLLFCITIDVIDNRSIPRGPDDCKTLTVLHQAAETTATHQITVLIVHIVIRVVSYDKSEENVAGRKSKCNSSVGCFLVWWQPVGCERAAMTSALFDAAQSGVAVCVLSHA
jgi:hypothetical protein